MAPPAPGAGRDFSFYIDRGGTFTDVVASVPDAAAPGGVRFRVTKARRARAQAAAAAARATLRGLCRRRSLR
jgi:N-methylhydantoinase A/oxoprolinase/acetone carboxylase beta subunit